ncbi:AMP-binding protein [Desulfonema limicola]|uniref:AMP-binding protein n=1 Tax=Desulfonema limicola TaxID=45656 RepID=UPI001A9B4142|nr:AMP-binding protein [Desulfonema limicola]
MYQYEKPDNLVELIENSVAKYPDNLFFGTKNKNGEYEWVRYGEVGKRIDNLRAGLAGLGIKKGDAVGIIANNRTEWAIISYAAYGLVGRYIPMYEKELVKIWKHIIIDGGIKVLFVATQTIYDQIKEMQDEFPSLEKIYLIEGEGENTMAGLEALGAANPVASIHPGPQDIAALIYTSGTTGNPKGVLLSHGNYTSNFIAASKIFPDLDQNIRVFSILPWAHSFGQTADLHLSTYLGSSIGFMDTIATLGDDMAKVQPTFLIAVPRVFNKIYAGLQAKMNETGGLAKKLFTMGIEAGKKRRELAEKGESDFLPILNSR